MKISRRKDTGHQVFRNAVALKIMLPSFFMDIAEKKRGTRKITIKLSGLSVPEKRKP